MRFVTLLIFLVIAGLALPILLVAGCFNLAMSETEPGGYVLFEQSDFEEELDISNVVGGWVTGLSASRPAWMQFRQYSHPMHPVPPPPKYA